VVVMVEVYGLILDSSSSKHPVISPAECMGGVGACPQSGGGAGI
jgi:hypothetical protein